MLILVEVARKSVRMIPPGAMGAQVLVSMEIVLKCTLIDDLES